MSDSMGFDDPFVVETIGEEIFPAPSGSRPLGCPCNGPVGQSAAESSGVPWGKVAVAGAVLGVLGLAWYFGTRKTKNPSRKSHRRASGGAAERFLDAPRGERRSRRRRAA